MGRFTQELREQAKFFRKNPTLAEKALWAEIRKRKLGGYKFRRQVTIDRFVVDFCCLENKVIVELDGGIHLKQQVDDRIRTAILEDLGFRIIRFGNEEVVSNLEDVKARILEFCEIPLARPLSRDRERGAS